MSRFLPFSLAFCSIVRSVKRTNACKRESSVCVPIVFLLLQKIKKLCQKEHLLPFAHPHIYRVLGRLSFIHRICGNGQFVRFFPANSTLIPPHVVLKCNKSKNKKQKKLKNLCEKGQFIDKNRSTESGTKIREKKLRMNMIEKSVRMAKITEQ